MLRSRKMTTASFLFAGRACLWTLPLWDEQLTSLGCAPGFLQIVVSGCMAGGCCSPFYPRADLVLSGVCLSQIYCSLKLHALSPAHWKNSRNLTNLLSKQIAMEICFPPCVALSVSPSLTFLCDHGSLPIAADMTFFSSIPCLHTSYHLQYGLYSTFHCGVCYALNQVNF